MTRDKFIRKWLANPQKQYNEQCRDEMRDDLDLVIQAAIGKSEQKQLITEIMNEDAKDGLYKKQTAVEWFAEQIIRKHPIITQYLPNYNFDKELIEQAKEMEKQQIMVAHIHGHNAPSSTVKMYDAGQYYNEEYGK